MLNIPNQQSVIDFYGKKIQSTIAMEECAELIQAISKLIRYSADKVMLGDNITEEIADVLICIEQLKLMYKIDDKAIQKWIDYKCQRQVERFKIANKD